MYKTYQRRDAVLFDDNSVLNLDFAPENPNIILSTISKMFELCCQGLWCVGGAMFLSRLELGIALNSRPMKKCPTLTSLDGETSRLEFRMASICVRIRKWWSCSRVSPILRKECRFSDFTAASHNPTNCGALGGIVWHETEFSLEKVLKIFIKFFAHHQFLEFNFTSGAKEKPSRWQLSVMLFWCKTVLHRLSDRPLWENWRFQCELL